MGRTSFCTGRGRQRSRPDNTLVLRGPLISGEESGGCGTDALPAQSPLRTGSEPFHSTNPDSVGSRKGSPWFPLGRNKERLRSEPPSQRKSLDPSWPVTASRELVCSPVHFQPAPGHSRNPNPTAQGHFSGQRPPL